MLSACEDLAAGHLHLASSLTQKSLNSVSQT